MTSAPVWLIVPPIDRRADLLRDRHRLARHHRLVDGAAALDHLAVDRHLLARADAQAIADLDAVELDLLLAPVRADAPRRLGREIEEGADRAARRLARAQLEHLSEQHEHGDDRGRLEVDRDRAVRIAKGGREDAGRERRDDAVDPGHARAHGDEREHVEVAAHHRAPAALEERPAGPEHHRRGEQQLEPIGGALADQVVQPDQMPPISSAKTGSVKASPIQKRRVMSTSSWLGPASAPTRTGSSAMPQIGQEPGPTWRTSGCIGQV